MNLYAYAIYLEEREYHDEDAPSALVHREIISVWPTEHQAEEDADVLNLDGVGGLTSRIRAVVVQVEVTERYYDKLLRVRS